jgi:mRNA interferase RelE/StbE
MTWTVQYTRTFLKEMARLSANVRQRVEAIAFGEAIQDDPYLMGNVKKLKGYQEYYRLRVGQYRVGIRIDSVHHIVEFCRVLHRKDIYRKFP